MQHHIVEVHGHRFWTVGPAELVSRKDGVTVYNEYVGDSGVFHFPGVTMTEGKQREPLAKIHFAVAGRVPDYIFQEKS